MFSPRLDTVVARISLATGSIGTWRADSIFSEASEEGPRSGQQRPTRIAPLESLLVQPNLDLVLLVPLSVNMQTIEF